MRWFLLLTLGLVTLVGNTIGATGFEPARIPGILFFNAMVFALFWTWWHAYFTSDLQRQQGIEKGMFLLLACMGVFLMVQGLEALATDDCSGFLSEGGRRRILTMLINAAAQLLSTLHLCRAAGLAMLLAGAAAISWSLKKLVRR